MHRLFISDLHLSENTPAIEAALVALLAREQELDALVILGDFFEAWVGDDDDAPLADRVRSQLFEFSRRGCEIFVARGNRDFMLGEQFAHFRYLSLMQNACHFLESFQYFLKG